MAFNLSLDWLIIFGNEWQNWAYIWKAVAVYGRLKSFLQYSVKVWWSSCYLTSHMYILVCLWSRSHVPVFHCTKLSYHHNKLNLQWNFCLLSEVLCRYIFNYTSFSYLIYQEWISDILHIKFKFILVILNLYNSKLKHIYA